jgi:hypothetical protein
MTKPLTALVMVDPAAARARIVEAFRDADGVLARAALALDVSRATLNRIVAEDATLATELAAIRLKLYKAGAAQVGVHGLPLVGPRATAKHRLRADRQPKEKPPEPARVRGKRAGRAPAPTPAPKRARRKP